MSPRLRQFGEFAAVLAVAGTLRAPITSIPPQVLSLRDDLGLTSQQFALITAIPLVCFALAAPFPISRLARRVSADHLVGAALALLTVAVVIRGMGGVSTLFLGTVLVGTAIAVLNVSTPAIIRRDYRARLTVVMPVYTAVLAVMASAGAGFSVPLATATTGDWRGGVTPWALMGGVALVLWLPMLRRGSASSDAGTAAPSLRPLLRSRTAWAVTLFMGLQSSVFYASVAWLPEFLQSSGHSEASAGALLGLTTLAGFVFTLLVPLTVGRGIDQRVAVALTAAAPALGYLGLALADGRWTLLFLTLAGVGHAALAVALVLIGLRAHSVAQTAALSAMAQGIGYGLAAGAPVALGLLHDISDGWRLPLLALVVLNLLQLAIGLRAAHPEG